MIKINIHIMRGKGPIFFLQDNEWGQWRPLAHMSIRRVIKKKKKKGNLLTSCALKSQTKWHHFGTTPLASFFFLKKKERTQVLFQSSFERYLIPSWQTTADHYKSVGPPHYEFILHTNPIFPLQIQFTSIAPYITGYCCWLPNFET